MHTFRKVNDACWEVGYYRPPVQGSPHNVWIPLVAFSDLRITVAATNALNGGGNDETFTEGTWTRIMQRSVPVTEVDLDPRIELSIKK